MDMTIDGMVTILAADARMTKPPLLSWSGGRTPECDQPSVHRGRRTGEPTWGVHGEESYLLMIHPLVLGTGRRLFGGAQASLRLVDSIATSTGVLIATYEPAPG
jgi:hypothetical protein